MYTQYMHLYACDIWFAKTRAVRDIGGKRNTGFGR